MVPHRRLERQECPIARRRHAALMASARRSLSNAPPS